MPRGSFERIWIWYTACLLAAVVAFGPFGANWGGHYHPVEFAAIHVLVGAAAWWLPKAARSDQRLRIYRCLFSAVGLTIVFSSLGVLLPGIHPEPYEWRFIASDRWLFGGDPTNWAGRLLGPFTTEILQWSYAAFYLIPMVTIAAAAFESSIEAFDRCRDLIVFGFLLSYLGYLWWPTLPPYHFLYHETEIEGVWLAADIHRLLERAELHRWNCFPSGHTMLSVVSLALAWRYARIAFWVLLPVVVCLIASTIALRYHYATDVIAGMLGAPLALWLGGRVLADDA